MRQQILFKKKQFLFALIMSVSENQIKEIVKKGLLDILSSYDFTRQKLNDNVAYQQSSELTDRTVKDFSKSIKTFVELSLKHDIECLFVQISNIKKETWKIDAHNLARVILDKSKLICVQDNLNNIIDNCINKAKQSNSKPLNDSEIDISPLLQPEHVSEIADCISAENPLDIRLNALRVLLKSHVSEVVNEETWTLLQKKLVDNLCDSNIDVFVVCLKVHAKLGTCSSSLTVKECSLNILDSLARHYLLQHSDSKVISLQSMCFYRMVYLTRYLLDTFREATLSIARFGESKLDEMIDNFINLMTIHVPSKVSRNKPCLSPLEVVSYLDPEANWLKNLFHFTLTRKLVFSCLSKSVTFLRISVEEIVHWANEPVIPSKLTSKVSEGEINIGVHKFSLFSHSLSVISSICLFSDSRTLFPLKLSKQEDLMGFESLLEILIDLLDNERFIDIMNTKASEFFVNLFTFSLVKLLSTNFFDSSSLMLLLISSRDDKNPLENPIKLKIFDTMYLNNDMLGTSLVSKRKQSLFSSSFKSKLNNELFGNFQQTLDLEHKSSMRISIIDNGNTDLLLSEVFLKHITNKLKCSEINEVHQLLKILHQILRRFYGVAVVNYPYILNILNIVCKIYTKLIDSFKNVGIKHKNDDILLNESCEQVLLQAATTSLGFHDLYKNGVVASLLLNKVQYPVTNWSDNAYLMFLSKSASTDEGSRSLCKESSGILRNYFDVLWSSLEDDYSGSELPVGEAAKSLYRVIAYLCISLKGLKALSSDLNEGSEITLTDDSDLKPTNLCLLIQHLALNTANFVYYTHHEIALTVLDILVSNIDSSLYLQHKFKFQDILLQSQSDNRIDENSAVIIDECSILRQKIIDRTYVPKFRFNAVPSHTAPRPESTLALTRSRSRGNGDLSRWLSETRLGLHDNNWLKHVRKLYKNSIPDEIKGTTIIDLLEQVVRAMPENRVPIKWQSHIAEDLRLEPEELHGIQLVVRYGIHLRLIQSSQQNLDNLKQLLKLVKASVNHDVKEFEGFDWFVASVYIVCSGNIEKSQTFLSSVSCLPNGPLMWYRIRNDYVYAQLGNALEMIISEEMPSLFQLLFREGLSWWNLCSLWINQCWWNVLEWSHICHWLVISILYQTDHMIYFCVAILHANHDRLLQLAQQGTLYQIIANPVERINFLEAKHLMEKLHKKYHISIQNYFTSF